MGKILDDDDMEDIRQAMTVKKEYDKLKEEKEQRRQIIDQDLKERWARIEMSLEKDRLAYLQNASVETLMAIAKEPAQLEALYKTARLRTLASLPPDKALALMMEDKTVSADVAKEIIVSINESGKTEQYERLITELKEAKQSGEEAYQKNLQGMVEFFNNVLGTVSTISGGTPPASQAPAPSYCPACGSPVQPGYKFCQACGKQVT